VAGRHSATYRRLGRFFLGYKGPLGVALSLALAASVAFAFLPWPIRYLIDGVLLSDELDLAGFATFETATDGQKLSLGYHASTSTGDTIFRSINDARAIQEVMIFGIQAWVLPIFQVTLMIVLMLALDVWLTLAAVCVGPLLVLAIRRLTGRIQTASEVSRGHMSQLTSLIEQTAGSIRAVQVFGTERNEGSKFDTTSKQFIKAQLRFRMSEQALQVTTMTLTGLGTALVLYVASRRVIDTALTVGALWIFINYMQRIYEVLQQNMSLFGVLQDSIVGVGRAFEVLDTEPDITDAPDATEVVEPVQRITFERASLAYDDGEPVLRDLDLTVERGERIALVGPTGAGKTSVLNLIPRLYDTTEGAVRFDDADVRDLTLVSLRSQVSLVPQEPLLFATSVSENIRYGRTDATPDEIEAAAVAARAHDFISALPDGYDTDVGDRGAKLSIGQQQRVAIARAFLKDAPILLLDEPTSALDLGTEADLLESIDDLMAGRTVFIVAHRLSTVRSATRIVVLDGGRIVEVGPHNELVTAGGLYSELWDRQFAV